MLVGLYHPAHHAIEEHAWNVFGFRMLTRDLPERICQFVVDEVIRCFDWLRPNDIFVYVEAGRSLTIRISVVDSAFKWGAYGKDLDALVQAYEAL